MSTKKSSGLAQFGLVNNPGAPAPASVAQPAAPAADDQTRQRGKGAMVSLTVRVSREQWQRIHELAMHDGKSINAMAIEGISRLFKEKGLKPL
jgi:hypothetical protein